MLLPNNQDAVIDIAKLKDYCLNEHHPVGKHKAYLFRKLLGITSDDAEILKGIVYSNIRNYEAVFEREDDFGKRYSVDFPIQVEDNQVLV